MASGTSSDIIEGYICPICILKFTTLEYLLEHNNQHKRNERKFKFSRLLPFRTTSLKQAVDNKRRDARLSVALSSRRKRDATITTELQVKFDSEFEISVISNDTDRIITRSHSGRFKEYRTAHIQRHGKEEDRCLAKLKDLSFGNNKRKSTIWRRFKEVMDVDNEKSCFSCAKPFDVFRWKHTCKICETLICEACSSFSKKQDAMSLISPQEDRNSKLDSRQGPRQSISSTTTNIEGNTKETEFRLCENCTLLLKFIKARRKTEDCILRLIEVYTKIHDCKVLTENNMDIYKKVYQSLLAGETLYGLSDAVTLSQTIGKFTMELTALQKLLAGPNDKLHIAICRAIKDFLTEVQLLPKLPTQDQIEHARRARFLALGARYRVACKSKADDDFVII